jgi:hypothetical protein
MIDLLQKSSPQQFTEFPCIDLIGLRAMKEQSILERITDQDAVRVIDEFQV